MARAIEYKVDLTLKREGNEITHNLTEIGDLPLEGTEQFSDMGNSTIVQAAKDISDYNQLQIVMAKKTLFPNEDERTVTITQKRLVE